PVRTRMAIGEAKVFVTTAAFYPRKVAEWRRELPGLKYVLLIDSNETQSLDGIINFNAAMAQSNFVLRLTSMRSEGLALLHFTSGTTGRPKGAMQAIRSTSMSERYAVAFSSGVDMHISSLRDYLVIH